jgi:hypothetical protein
MSISMIEHSFKIEYIPSLLHFSNQVFLSSSSSSLLLFIYLVFVLLLFIYLVFVLLLLFLFEIVMSNPADVCFYFDRR